MHPEPSQQHTADSLAPLLHNDLRGVSERLAEVVGRRFFAGSHDEETAAALGLSDRTVRRDWLKARAWLRCALGDSAALEDPGPAP